MRDLIWTLIIIWLVYKIVDLFKNSASKRNNASSTPESGTQNGGNAANPNSNDIKNVIQKHLNKEGEYVDFEEMK